MAVDRRSALTKEEPVYTRFAGPKLQCPQGDAAKPIDDRVVAWVTAARATTPDAGGGIAVAPRGRSEAPVSVLGHEFVLKDCVRRRVPREFDPGDVRFSDHAHGLAKAWAGCLLELHALLEVDHQFAIGFIVSEDAEAEFEKSSEYGRAYYLNPCVVGRKSIRRRWKKTNRFQIAAIAAHEFVHGGLGLSYHGEDFANKLTDVMGVVLSNWRRFARHLK
jgi:hypothetical protein